MTHRHLRVIFALALICHAPVASADPIVRAGDVIKMADGPGTTGGGEFIMTVNDAWSFITFCLQRTEYIDFSHVFDVDAVSTFALSDPNSNGGDSAGRDYLSPHTAFLYTAFRRGTLAGYIPGDVASANRLQRAIWMFEQELPMDPENAFVIAANRAIASGAWSGLGDVRALNLSRNGVEAQDQLALVPEPSLLIMLASGVALAAARRRRSAK